MKELALNMSSKFGFSVSDTDAEYLDNVMEDIAMTALAPKVISFLVAKLMLGTKKSVIFDGRGTLATDTSTKLGV